MAERPTVYCCLDHALCDVEIPGAAGEQARREYDRLYRLGRRWCGKARGPSGAIVLVHERRGLMYLVRLTGGPSSGAVVHVEGRLLATISVFSNTVVPGQTEIDQYRFAGRRIGRCWEYDYRATLSAVIC